MISKLLASGAIEPPYGPGKLNVPGFSSYSSQPGAPFFMLLGNLFKLAIVIAGIFALWNFLFAGYQFMSAGGDPKNISKAWEKIYQSVIGLFIAAGSITIAGVIGYLIFKDATFLIIPRIVTPTP